MTRRRLSLNTLVTIGAAALILVPALVTASLYAASLQQRGEELTVEMLKMRGKLSANLLARRIYGAWTEVARLADIVDPVDLAAVREQIRFMSRLEPRYSWLGIADLGGKVIAAKDRMLESENVAQRLWFRRGIDASAVIDVQEADALKLPASASAEPNRVVIIAAPLRHEGSLAGVIGAQIDWNWFAEPVASLVSPGIDLLLLSRDGVVLSGPPDLAGKPLSTGSAQAAGRGASVALTERWPDGKDYFTVTIPTVGYADLPSFGWSLLIRQNAEDALAQTRDLVRSFWITFAQGLLAVLALLYLASRWLTTPLRRLTAAAEAILQDPYSGVPHTETRFDEVARLSDALVRLQSKLMAKADR
jgi:HAMP domain-containing protein